MLMSQIENYINDLFLHEDYADAYVVEIEQSENSLGVYWDADSGISLGDCQRLSRLIEAYIEEHELMPADYKIDVSSPGLDRPLKFRRQYDKNIGRTFKIQHNDRTDKGKLDEVNDEGIVLIQKVKREKIKLPIAWDDITRAKVIPSF